MRKIRDLNGVEGTFLFSLPIVFIPLLHVIFSHLFGSLAPGVSNSIFSFYFDDLNLSKTRINCDFQYLELVNSGFSETYVLTLCSVLLTIIAYTVFTAVNYEFKSQKVTNWGKFAMLLFSVSSLLILYFAPSFIDKLGSDLIYECTWFSNKTYWEKSAPPANSLVYISSSILYCAFCIGLMGFFTISAEGESHV